MSWWLLYLVWSWKHSNAKRHFTHTLTELTVDPCCSRCTCTSAYKIDHLFCLRYLQVWALSASHKGSWKEAYAVYQGERMTARALIVNHWQHYWTSPPLPIWICVGKLREPVINQSITHTGVRAHKLPPRLDAQTPPPSLTLTHTHTHIHLHTHTRFWDDNKCADNQPMTGVSFFCVDHPLCQFCLSSAVLYS